MSKIRVLLVTGSYPPMRCGVGDYTERLARGLARCGDVEVSVITTTRADAPGDAETALSLRHVMQDWTIRRLPTLVSAVRSLRPDLVHLQFPTQGYDSVIGPALIPCLARTILSIPAVVTLHEYMPRSLKSQVARFPMFSCAAGIVVVRPDYQSKIPTPMSWFVRENKIRFVPNASVIPRASITSAEREAVRRSLGCGSRKLVSYFGFAYPYKGVEQLFGVADPGKHHLLLICELSPDDAYHARLLKLVNSSEWKDHVTITGFVDSGHAAKLLAAADAAVFPFTGGGGTWNSSLHAAMLQGTFAIVTSLERRGYAGDENVYYAAPGAVNDMRTALDQYAGNRNTPSLSDQWAEIARAHVELYQSVIK
jgi:glycosyltransferase involved in cell wall biosynthesis